jgi:uncharacterized protein
MPKVSVNQALVVIIVLLVGVLIGTSVVPAKIVTREVFLGQNATIPGLYSVGMYVPAVDKDGHGVATELTVETKPGLGRILTNIDKLVFWVDTQTSIQIARTVAENYTGVDMGSTDMIYTINTNNASVIGGPSAGAALTLATIAALEHRQLNHSIMITGTINDDGSIGPIGGVLEKAKAARSVGATLFLVPVGEGTETVMEPVEKCVQKPQYIYCETKYQTSEVNIGASAGIEVKEVANVTEAVKYFL